MKFIAFRFAQFLFWIFVSLLPEFLPSLPIFILLVILSKKIGIGNVQLIIEFCTM